MDSETNYEKSQKKPYTEDTRVRIRKISVATCYI